MLFTGHKQPSLITLRGGAKAEAVSKTGQFK